MVAVAVEALHELEEGQRSHAYLVPAPPELRHDVMREELRVAPRHVHVDVAHAQKPVEHAIEPGRSVRVLELLARDGVLGLVEEDVVLLAPVRDLRAQVVVEEVEEQVRLPSAADARDELAQAVVHAVDKPVEIPVPPDFNTCLVLIHD